MSAIKATPGKPVTWKGALFALFLLVLLINWIANRSTPAPAVPVVVAASKPIAEPPAPVVATASKPIPEPPAPAWHAARLSKTGAIELLKFDSITGMHFEVYLTSRFENVSDIAGAKQARSFVVTSYSNAHPDILNEETNALECSKSVPLDQRHAWEWKTDRYTVNGYPQELRHWRDMGDTGSGKAPPPVALDLFDAGFIKAICESHSAS